MGSQAFAGVGTKFQRWNGATWDDVAEVNAIDGPGMTKDVLEVTSLDTDAGYNEFITGFAEGGTLTLDMNFTRETYELMKEDFESDEVRSYRIQLPDYDSEPSTFTIEGLVIELPITMSADDKVTADVVIQITSQVVLDVGSTVPAEESETPAESSETPAETSSGASVYEQLMTELDDGNTAVFFLFEEGVTVEDTDKVIGWEDLMGSAGTELEVSSDGTRPTLTATGVSFDGVDDVLSQAAVFSNIPQPYTVYLVAKNTAYASNAHMVNLSSETVCFRQYGTDNRISWIAGSTTVYTNYDNFFQQQHNIAIVCGNGSGTWIRQNYGPKTSGDPGVERNINRIAFGAYFTGINNAAIEVACLIVRTGEDSEAKIEAICDIINQAYLHTPSAANAYDADPSKVILTFLEALDPESDDMVASDFTVQNRTVIAVAVDSTDNTKLNLTLSTPITVGGEHTIAYISNSAGGLLTATGEIVPKFKLQLTNNTTT